MKGKTASMELAIEGHHVTAIAGGPTVKFSLDTEAPGLRLMKQTAPLVDPGSYHVLDVRKKPEQNDDT